MDKIAQYIKSLCLWNNSHKDVSVQIYLDKRINYMDNKDNQPSPQSDKEHK